MTFDVALSSEVLALRVYNEEVNRRLQATTILRVLDKYVSRDKISIDVGAATGHITNYLAPRSRRVFAYEAVYPVWQQLLKMGDRHPNVVAIHAAVGNFDGVATIFVDDKRLSNSGFIDLVGGPSVEVDARRLDALLESGGEYHFGAVGFIKIDVEGTELDVIEGAWDIITRDRPNMMIEIYEPYSDCPVGAIFEKLFGIGYTAYYYDHSNPVGLVPVDTVERGVKAVQELHAIHDGDFLFKMPT